MLCWSNPILSQQVYQKNVYTLQLLLEFSFFSMKPHRVIFAVNLLDFSFYVQSSYYNFHLSLTCRFFSQFIRKSHWKTNFFHHPLLALTLPGFHRNLLAGPCSHTFIAIYYFCGTLDLTFCTSPSRILIALRLRFPKYDLYGASRNRWDDCVDTLTKSFSLLVSSPNCCSSLPTFSQLPQDRQKRW